MKVLAILGVTGVLFGVIHAAGLHRAPTVPGDVGRYQMMGVEGKLYVLDTAHGQCWSRVRRNTWISEGNPAINQRDREPVVENVEVRLSEKSVRMTVRQRRSKALPGSEGTVWVQVDDITAGQVLVSVRTRNRKMLLDDVSLKEGQIADFRFDGQPYVIRLTELNNVLIGEDFTIVEVARQRDDLPPWEPRAKADATDDAESPKPQAAEKNKPEKSDRRR